MKHYQNQKIFTTLAGVILAGTALSAIPAHALEPIPPDVDLDPTEIPIPTAPPICIEPWWHLYELDNLDLHAGDVLQLQFTSEGAFRMSLSLWTDDDKNILSEYIEGEYLYEWTVPEDMDAVTVGLQVYSDNDAELADYKVVSESSELYVRDVVLLTKYLHGKQMISRSEFEKLDRNQDQIVNIYDFLLVKQELLGMTHQTQEIEFTGTIDATSAVLRSGWESAMSDENYIINSQEELEQLLTPMFRESVVRTLLDAYPTEFFKDHTLCLNLWMQDATDDFIMQIGDVSCKDQQLQINYQKAYINGFVGEQKVLISQVAVPKQEYTSVKWGITGEKSLNYEYVFSGTSSSKYLRELEHPLITDYQQLQEYAQYLPPECMERYTEEFFETKAVYFRPVEYGMLGVTEQAWNVTKPENSDMITFDVKSISPVVGCDAMMLGIGQLILDREDAENAKVSCRTYQTVEDWEFGTETFDGETHDYLLSGSYCAVNASQYSFRGKQFIEIYLTNYLRGTCRLIQAYELDPDSDFRPFTAGTETEASTFEGENYVVSYDSKTKQFTVKFRTDENSDDWEILEFTK